MQDNIAVKQVDNDIVPHEVLARAIVDISEGMKKLNSSRLKRDAIILLLHDMSHVGKRDIGYVLASMDQLEATYLKPVVGGKK